ncbi:hypothetical protein [Xanthomonas phage DES1]|nr:hypothetical protein [Xanthomonas phage DES1]
MANIRRRPEPGTKKDQDVNETGHATESFPTEGTTPAGSKPQMGASEGQLAQISTLMEAVKEYDNALTTAEKTNGKLWEEFAKLTKMTKEEAEPILRETLKRAKADATISESALTTTGQYVSRVRAGLKAEIKPKSNESANAFYKRAREKLAGEKKEPEANTGEAPKVVAQGEEEGYNEQDGKKWIGIMGRLRETLQQMTIEELEEVEAFIASRAAEKVVELQKVAQAA